MSNIRVALVVEGPLDRIILQAALNAIVPCPFILTVLQPEATKPKMGNGWSGVLKWCDAASDRHTGSLDNDPTLAGFDLLIIHIDADVADKKYLDCGQNIENLAISKNCHVLPCSVPCPPVGNTCQQLHNVIKSWLGNATIGQKTVLCLPSKSLGSWLAAAILPVSHTLMNNLECNPTLEQKLEQLPLKYRVKKNQADFRKHESSVKKNWNSIKSVCAQAAIFDAAISVIAHAACQQATP
jgi:hypothetical protein